MSKPVGSEILEAIRELPSAEQRRVLDFARALAASKPRAVPGTSLLRFSGTIAKHELARMTAAIQEECERVDPECW